MTNLDFIFIIIYWYTVYVSFKKSTFIQYFTQRFMQKIQEHSNEYVELNDSLEITNKMRPCNRIYYSNIHWRLNMSRAAYCSSSGALAVFAASGLCKYVYAVKSEWELQFPLILDYGRSPHAYVNQRLQIQSELLTMSGMPLETCWALNERWINKFYYKVASCWLFLQGEVLNYWAK